ncbi:efflux RND transporter periplasmic adaptor subunit [Undibacterium seohonense]|uniref:Efflux RND transporter periplasmic adaptor subunit n=1 Tax=Undibacterium seohonense TaxID=1344950 RepID=A0ABR6X501_9BURK|nr:efflux RND transporter periplasmic adaptor subunit [Undibacterium seohonense]MBC3807852.1 efflux RND transporter periplasmic adaptor subunit [Undibacterium seohonense]
MKNLSLLKPTMKFSTVFLPVLFLVQFNLAQAHGDEDHSKKPAKPATKSSAVASVKPSILDATSAQRLSDGSLFVPKIVQRQLALRTLLTEQAELPNTIELNGKVLADPNAGGRVQASQPGRLETGPSGLPSLGQRVTKGQVLAYLRPVMSSLDRGNSQSILADIDSQLSIAERKVQRYEQLAEALPKATVEAARFDYEALKKRKAAVESSLSKSEALIAPVSGIISVANAVTGQVFDAKETLFEIIDPNRLMVEALAYDPILTSDIANATATWNQQRTSAAANTPVSLALNFVGGGQQMREQAIPLLFRVSGKSTAVAVGQTIKVIIQTKRLTTGFAVPNSSVIKLTGGESVVWVHTEAERFVQRKVVAHSLDGERVSIISGLKDDERVVTTGASLLAQVK